MDAGFYSILPSKVKISLFCLNRQPTIRSYPVNFIKLSPLFTEIWSFEIIHCLNFNTQRQKCHVFTNDAKVKFRICGFVGCMKKMLFLANILFIILSMCAMEFTEKLTRIYFCLKFA